MTQPAANKPAPDATCDEVAGLAAQLDELLANVGKQESQLAELVDQLPTPDDPRAFAQAVVGQRESTPSPDLATEDAAATDADMSHLVNDIELLLKETQQADGEKVDQSAKTTDAAPEPVEASRAANAKPSTESATIDVGDDLAEQIQALLDEANAMAEAADAATTPEPEPDLGPDAFDDGAFVSIESFMDAVAKGEVEEEAAATDTADEFDTAVAVDTERSQGDAPPSAEVESKDAIERPLSDAELVASIASLGTETTSTPDPSDTTARSVSDIAETNASAENATAAPPPQTISAIDDYIAEQADDMLGGDFESVHEAIGSIAPEPTPAGINTYSPPVGRDLTPRHDSVDDLDPDSLDADAFATPEEVLHGASQAMPRTAAASFDATANDVASELDDQPEQRRGAAAQADGGGERALTPPAAQDESPADAAASSPPRRKLHLRRLLAKVVSTTGRVGIETTYRACALINRPLQRLSPSTRHAVGYFAILHVFVGSALLLSKFAAEMLGK